MLVLEQPPHQLGARIFPRFPVGAREQHLGLETHQPARQLEVVCRLIESQLMNGGKKLIGDPCDLDVRDLELLFPQQVEQQIERS